jgi:hypothetical protein
MAIGAPAGLEVRRALNDGVEFGSTPLRETALLGDPTLRLHVGAPPSNVRLNGSTLAWTASLEPGAVYVVFGGPSMAGDFTRLTPAPITQTTCTVISQSVYQVRALALKVSGSGSYTNQSQGAFLVRWKGNSYAMEPRSSRLGMVFGCRFGTRYG